MRKALLRFQSYHRSLHGKFTLILIGVATLLALLASLVVVRLTFVKARESSTTTLESMLSAIEKSVAVGVYAEDQVLLLELIKGVARDPNVARVWVEDTAGKVLAASPLDGGSPAPPPGSVEASLLVTRRLVSPFDGAEELGHLLAQGSLPQVIQEANLLARWLGIAQATLITILALLLNHVVLLMLSKPMMRLSQQLSTIAPGSSQRLSVNRRHRNDEVGTVVIAVNGLLTATETALQAERQLRAEIAAMEAQYRQIFNHTSAGIFVLTPGGRLINSNPTVLRLIDAEGASPADLASKDFVDAVFADPEQVRRMIADASTQGQTMAADLALRSKGSEQRWVHCLISVQQASADMAEGMVEGVIYDVTQRKSEETAASHQALHDGLTGLKNRVGVIAALDQMLQQAQASGHAVTLLFLDLDGFKKVNDELGHEAGDAVIVECAKRMRGVLRRSSDIAGRVGGDELVLLLDRVDAEAPMVQALAQNLLRIISEPIALRDGRTAQVGASIGLASYPRHALHRAALFNAADAAMYEVKRHGKNAWRVAESLSQA
ncbi:sensor domain-containing diguanylate cyclase [Paucibacter sp. KCTC 42545]|uniref:sensor domain-containing diguanylate cyclase n=1 Tax=Paucibacter sp. KCTC 42545 TaxID=1768242 RepID=UPI000733B163|nr:sensor domain-containing diguanylate cyclase [Paucibacter sp. KCTC 42545]ALT77758.1 hypothetical protein AT984_11765 [Paucibacter sp. KCTC 42545]